jgi:sec-independent protein translocase protein TatB
MLNIGMGEMAVILIAALLVMGPDRLPEFARTLGKFLREFRRQTDDVRGVVMREIYKLETEADVDGTRTLAPPRPTAQTIAPPAAAALSVAGGLAGAPEAVDAAQVSTGPGLPPTASPEAALPAEVPTASECSGAGPAAPSSSGAASAAGTTASQPISPAGGTAAEGGAVPPANVMREAEAKVTIVDGIRIAPAMGTVARGAARPVAAAATQAASPAAGSSTASPAEPTPSPTTSRS